MNKIPGIMIKRIYLSLAAIFLISFLNAQQTTIYTEADRAFKHGEELLANGLFSQAQGEFENAVNLLLPVNETANDQLLAKAEFYYAKCAVLMELPDGEKLMLDFIRKHTPDPIANDALIEVANYYYKARDYKKALEYYNQAPLSGLSKKQKAEVKFRQGYALFVQQKFSAAKSKFKDIANYESDFYHPANYYLGLCYFFEGNYDTSVRHLRLAEKSKRYRPHIPYYLSQIYFAQRSYQELIDYAEPKLNSRGLRNQNEISQLVGQSYFEIENYTKALEYLRYYAEHSRKMREEEFYQLGFTEYQMGNYKKAALSFEELNGIDSRLGQSAMYYLADCKLRVGSKRAARTAFASAKRMDYDKEIQQEAIFNYAKLSYELKDSREAITSLQSFKPDSPYYPEAQKLMSEIFLSYRDYQQAMEIIEKLPNKTPDIQESYQKVTFFRGLQLLQKGDNEGAKNLFSRSLQFPMDTKTKALATYWQGDIAHREGQYETSIRKMDQFLTLARTITGLPDESSVFTANYIQGYNYLKKENYTAAVKHFDETVAGIKRNKSFIKNKEVSNNVLGDATVRAGDCYFKRNKYTSAANYYDSAISNRYTGFVYALYQKAIIEGLRGRTTEKILALEQISNDYPNSEYADEALLQLGITYQEINKLNKAMGPLQDLVQKYKNKSDLVNQALIQLGLISYNQGNLQTAINYYKQIFSNNPTPEEGKLALAALEEIYIQDLGQSEQYFAFLETVPGYKLDSAGKDAIDFKAAESQYERGNYARAIQEFTNYIRKHPNGIQLITAYYHRAESYTIQKEYDQGLMDYEYIVNRGTSRYYVKALEKASILAYNHAQDFQKAYNLYTKLEAASTTEDMRFEAQLGAMRSAYRFGNTQAVYAMAGKVATHPNATADQKSIANFYLGKISFDRRDFDNALSSFEEVKRYSDNEYTAEARYMVAEIYYQRRNLEKAQEICLNANKESSAYPYWVIKSILLLSDILVEKGQLYDARAALEAILENYDEDPDLVNSAQTKLNAINQQLNKNSNIDTNKTLELIDGN
jgi:tetratricopeptide (TPR) repeat protein